MRIKEISETKIWKYRPRIFLSQGHGISWEAKPRLSMLPRSKLCRLLCILLTWKLHTFSGCSICSILGEPSISGQHCSRVPYRHICHQQSVRTYVQASYLTALGKQGFGKKQQLCWSREGEAAQWPASSLDGWFGPEALNTWINQDTAKTGTLALLAPQRRSLNLSVPEKVIMFGENNYLNMKELWI